MSVWSLRCYQTFICAELDDLVGKPNKSTNEPVQRSNIDQIGNGKNEAYVKEIAGSTMSKDFEECW